MEELKQSYLNLIKSIGEDPDREGLQKTPERAAQAFEFLTRGYRANVDELINNAIYEEKAGDMVIVKDIEVYSLCEHHMLPFFGKCHIGYIPKGKVFGVSKLARIVDMFGRRLQLQERLTHEIATVIEEKIKPVGVGVIVEAQHLCMMMRGVEKQNSVMKTSTMLGLFRRNAATRNEFLQLIK